MDNKSKQDLLGEIEQALGSVDFGSVEIYVQDKKVTQISVRSIKKTSIEINQKQEEIPIVSARKDKFITIQARFRRTQQ